MKKNKKSYQKAFLLIPLLIALTLSLLFLDSFNSKAINHIEDLSRNQLEELSTQTSNAFRERIATSLIYVKSAAVVFSKNDDLYGVDSLSTLNRIGEESIFDRLFICDMTGNAIYSNGDTINIADRDYFNNAINGETGISDIIISKLDGNKVFIVYSPIYYDNEIVGMLGATYLVSRLADKIETNFFNNQGYTVIFQKENGEYILNSNINDDDFENDIWGFLESVEYDPDYNFNMLKNDINNDISGYTKYIFSGDTQYVYYSNVGINDWEILLVLPMSVISANTLKITSYALILLTEIVGVIFLVFLIIFLYENKKSKEYRNIYEELLFLTNTSPGGLLKYRFNEEKEIIYASDRFFEMIGYTKEEVATKFKNSFREIVCDKVLGTQIEEAQMKENKIYQTQYCIKTKSGLPLWISDQSTIIYEKGQKYCCCLIVDITEVKKVEKELRLSNERYDIIISQTDKVMLEYNIKDDVLKFLTNTDKIYGMSPVMKGLTSKVDEMSFIDDESKTNLKELIEKVRNGASKVFCIVKTYNSRGTNSWKRVYGSAIFDEFGVPTTAVGIIEDISTQKEAQIKIEKTQANLEGMISYATYAFIIDLKDGKVVYKIDKKNPNSKIEQSTDWYIELQNTILYYVSREDQRKVQNYFNLKTILSDYRNDRVKKTVEFRIKNDSGEFVWARAKVNVIEDTEKKEFLCYAYIIDIDAEKKREFYLLQQSERDSLTKLYNRRTAKKKIDEFLSKDNKSIHGFYMLDLDRFKDVNDKFGHNFGDKVIKSFADTLQGMFSDNDIVCRLGGDEFIILQKYAYSENRIKAKLGEVCNLIAEKYHFTELKLPMTTSIGAVIAPYEGKNFDELYKKVDKALYIAKEEGGNKFILYKEDQNN
ncbi:MAG: diguanylate cyclase [Bacilli bacterium]|nr:diguanylate cyclase [Bacilli bacterium]